jgi:cytochrome c oxidase subunit 1
MISSIGGFCFGLAQVFFLFIIVKTIKGGKKATDIVWEGATGLEFEELPSPAPYHSFNTAPEVK